jgi:hypothetical protein
MPNSKIAAGRKVAKNIRLGEDAIDGSLIQNANLLASMLEGRLEMGATAEVGHDAVMSIAAGLTALAQARNHIVTGHKQIADARDDLGFSPHAFGCTIGKIPPAVIGGLSVVEAA